jgi:S-DNA-T family DNA segregation ATPase FtsK/SpoIIIE
MNIILSVYTKIYFKEFLLPALNNSDYEVVLQKTIFQLNSDLHLKLEVLDNQWSIKEDDAYVINKGNIKYRNDYLSNNDILQLSTKYKENITIIVKYVPNCFHVYKKYKLNNIDKISIGRDSNNDIIYNYLGLISANHAQIVKKNESYYIINSSTNGVYVNSNRIDKEKELCFGDYINIIGLHMVYLGDYLALDDKITIDINPKLKSYSINDEETMILNESEETSIGKTLYHRAPRNYEIIEEGTVEIEEPPQLNKAKKQPLFMMIGPSITMALPMMLGSFMMIYASNSTGTKSSLYMYSGLIMSVSSALIGILWTLINIKYQKKEEQEYEAYRLDEYGKYLIEKTDQIKDIYSDNERKLKENYPEASICLNYSETTNTLWSRNKTHKDFLVHRLGLGDIAFPLKIDIPKKKFTLFKDDLANKPQFIKNNYENLYQVPITLDLMSNNLIGVIGGENKIGAIQIAKILTSQIAANNCYTDVKLGYIYNEKSSADSHQWDFAKWLPHVWSKDKKYRMVASNKDEASDIFYELTKIFRDRLENKDNKILKPYYIIFVSDLTYLEGEIFSKYILSNDNIGLTTILLTEKYEELPNNCEFIIENTNNFKGMYSIYDDEAHKQKIDFDDINSSKLDEFSRSLSSLQVLEIEEGGEIPNSLTFFEMLKINKLEDLRVKELWAKSKVYENIKGQIGEKAGGQPCYLDVHEKYHGPHGLVAGTTGSGKSETLQTYILSLAINYSPDDVGFFIIDYKGGGMANLFNNLPHMIGQISNLSGNQVKRAMISIKSENRRRQRVFSENGVNNINAYTKLYKNGEAINPIPHLFIIIDEFAELKREEPEFMQELISVAQVGRSLGVHLILATQKPSGTVDENIWSNSKFKLCLRVQDRQDSNDMLHKPDAAYITQAGRCYLQVGNDEIYELFQSGYSGAVYDEEDATVTTDIAKMLNTIGKVELTGNSIKQSQKKKFEIAWVEKLIKCFTNSINKSKLSILECINLDYKMQQLIEVFYDELNNFGIEYPKSKYNSARLSDFIHLYVEAKKLNNEATLAENIIELSKTLQYKIPQQKEKTQLDAVIDYLKKIAEENGYNHVNQLWMPVLADYIYLQEFEEFNRNSFMNNQWQYSNKNWDLSIIAGKMDDPENQNQMPLVIDFKEDGNIAIIGTIVSGKSTLMQTIAFSLINKYTPDCINLYAIDFSSKLMSAFEEAPHFGGVMYDNDLDKISKFFNMISKILEERKVLFRGGNYQQYVQVNGMILPTIIIFIDNYSSFKDKTEEKYEDIMIKLSKEGINHGIYLIVSGAGYGINDISNRIGENINTVLTLSLPDQSAYSDYFPTNQLKVLPETGIKGRGLAYYGNRILEYQSAISITANNDYERLEKIKSICISMKNSWNKPVAKKIPEIPNKPIWSNFIELNEFKEQVKLNDLVPVGYDQTNADIYSLPLRELYCYLITGLSKSGKTNYMRVIVQSVLMKDANICIIDTPNKILRQYESNEKITYVNDEQSIFNYFKNIIPDFQKRNQIKNQLLDEGYDESDIFDVLSKEKPYFIFITDLSWFVPFIYEAQLDMRGFLENIIEKGSLHNIYFFSEINISQMSELSGYKIYELFKSYGKGIHFGGKIGDNRIFDYSYLPYRLQDRAEKPGIGLIPNLIDDKDTYKIVIPIARK